MIRARAALFLGLSLLAATPPGPAAAAGSYDPDLEYRAITTPHFYVVYATGYEHIGRRTAQIAEDLFPYLARRYRYEPSGRITIVINDQTDTANGSAAVSPFKLVTLFVTAPTEVSGLEDYDDWLQAVVVHELSHVFQLDMVYGLPVVGRWLFGKYVALNQYTPAWVTEGLAVYEETVSSGAGRGRSSYVDMVLRTAALEDRFPALDEGYRSYSIWPFANVAYFVGGRFQLWLAEKFGEEALLHYHRAYASTPIPYLSVLSAEIAFGSTMESLWARFELETKADALLMLGRVQSSTLGQTLPERLTRYGGDLLGPRITPDGKSIVYSTFSPTDGRRIRRIRIDGSHDEALVNDVFSDSISFSADGQAFYFQQLEINQRYYFHNKLFRYDLRNGAIAELKIPAEEAVGFLAPSGAPRARDPDASRDGQQLVFVQTPYGANQLVLARLDDDGVTIHPRVILPPVPDVTITNPRFSPDGTRIALSRMQGGRRDLIVVDTAGQLLLEVTRDREQDIQPTWSPDGRFLLFASDRGGIYNLYAYELATDVLRQLTNVISGAYQPSVSPDGQTLVFRGYSADGFDVYKIPFVPEAGRAVPRALDPVLARDDLPRRWPEKRPDVPPLPPPAPPKDAPLLPLPPGFEEGPYSAVGSLLPFHDNWNLLPNVSVNERELFGQLTTVGADALETQSYVAWMTYGSATNFVGGGLAYFNDQLEPTLSLSAATDVRTFSLRNHAGDFLSTYDEQRYVGTVGISLPLLQRHLISFGYIFEHRLPWRALSEEVLAQARSLPAGGNYARVQLGYTYNNTRAFPYSISRERGFSAAIAIQGLSKGLGSDYEQLVISGELRHYLTIPFRSRYLQNHVLASRLAMRLSAGNDLADIFRMGGVVGQSILTTSTQDFFPLRGLLTAGLSGTALLNGSVEYRAPIYRLERGLGSWPIALRVLHAAVFADFGRVFDTLKPDFSGGFGPALSDFFSGFALGAGAELRADVLLGFVVDLELRLGYGHLLYAPFSGLDGSGFYFQIGSTY